MNLNLSYGLVRLDGQQTLPGFWSNEHTVCQVLEQLVCLMFGILARLMSAVGTLVPASS